MGCIRSASMILSLAMRSTSREAELGHLVTNNMSSACSWARRQPPSLTQLLLPSLVTKLSSAMGKLDVEGSLLDDDKSSTFPPCSFLSCCVMSSPPRELSWEPHVTIHPSLLEMTPLRIPSPAPDSPEYSCQGSGESSFSSDEGCPSRELGGGDALHVSSRGVIPCILEEGVTSHGLRGAPPPFPLAARPEGRSPRKLRIKLKSRSLGESS
ncbi:hypothetical protein Dimus_008124 [Dionaea muscipula]